MPKVTLVRLSENSNVERLMLLLFRLLVKLLSLRSISLATSKLGREKLATDPRQRRGMQIDSIQHILFCRRLRGFRLK